MHLDAIAFPGDVHALYHHHMNVPVPSLRQKMPTLPPAVEQVLLTALAKDPHQRYTSVQAFANALEAASQLPAPAPGTTLLTYGGHSGTIFAVAWSSRLRRLG